MSEAFGLSYQVNMCQTITKTRCEHKGFFVAICIGQSNPSFYLKRRMTTKEYAKLQGWPVDEFRKVRKHFHDLAALRAAIGNGMSFNVIQSVLGPLMEAIIEHKIKIGVDEATKRPTITIDRPLMEANKKCKAKKTKAKKTKAMKTKAKKTKANQESRKTKAMKKMKIRMNVMKNAEKIATKQQKKKVKTQQKMAVKRQKKSSDDSDDTFDFDKL